MKTRVWCAAVLAVMLGGAITGAAEEQWLQYRTSSEPWRQGVPYVSATLETVKEAPESLALPQFAGVEQAYAQWKTPLAPQGFIWLAFDRGKSSAAYSVYIDSNADGSLADEQPIRSASRSGPSRFEMLKVVFATDEGPVTYHINVTVYRYTDFVFARAEPAAWYEGQVDIAGKTYRCLMIDGNLNGTFNDMSADFAQMDMITLSQGDTARSYSAGRYLEIDGTLYEPRSARDGACISFEVARDVPMGSVSAPSSVAEASLGGELGLFHLSPREGMRAIPAGTYRLYGWTLTRKDPAGREWTLSGETAHNGEDILVEQGVETVLDVGEPVNAVLQAHYGAGEYRFSAQLAGRYGEDVSARIDMHTLPPPPTLRIVNADGTYNRVYKFQYG